MIPLLFALAVVQGATPALERLHPPGAMVFVQIPDVPALLDAYERAPVVRMVRDEEVRSSVEALLRSSGQDVGSLLGQGLQGLGLSPAFLESLPQGLRSVKSLSLSLSSALGDEEHALWQQHARALEQLLEIRALAQAHEAHHGAAPSDLSELDLPEPLRTDPWGNGYVLHAAQGSDEPALLSYGADGAPGGEGAAADVELQGDATPSPAIDPARALGLLAVVELRDEAVARAAYDGLVSQLAGRGFAAASQQELQLAGASARRATFQVPDGWGPGAWALQAGPRLILGALGSEISHLEARGAGTSRSLADAAPLRDLRKAVAGGGVTVVEGWVDLTVAGAPLQRMVRERFGFALTQAPAAWHMRLREGRFLTDVAFEAGEDRSGLLSSIGREPLPPSLWTRIPGEAVGIWAASYDAERLSAQVLGLLGADTDSGKERLRELEERHRFSMERDVAGGLGGSAALYLLPVSALIAPPPLVLVAEVRDRAAMQRGMEGLLALLQEQGGGAFEIRSKPYRDTPLWTLHPRGQGGFLASMVQPTLALLDGQLVLGLTSTRVKKEIQRALGGEASAHPWLASELEPPPEATIAGYVDWGALITGLYTGARGLLAMAGGFSGGAPPIDVAALPEAATFVRFFEPTVFWSRSVDGARLLHLESSFGPESWLGLAGLVGGASSARSAAPAPPPVAVDAPDPKGAQATRDTLDYLRTRLAVYRIENGRYPPSLASLLETSPKYPRGYLDGSELPGDGWGRPLLYRVGDDGASHALWSAGADGVDEQGGGDDVSS